MFERLWVFFGVFSVLTACSIVDNYSQISEAQEGSLPALSYVPSGEGPISALQLDPVRGGFVPLGTLSVEKAQQLAQERGAFPVYDTVSLNHNGTAKSFGVTDLSPVILFDMQNLRSSSVDLSNYDYPLSSLERASCAEFAIADDLHLNRYARSPSGVVPGIISAGYVTRSVNGRLAFGPVGCVTSDPFTDLFQDSPSTGGGELFPAGHFYYSWEMEVRRSRPGFAMVTRLFRESMEGDDVEASRISNDNAWHALPEAQRLARLEDVLNRFGNLRDADGRRLPQTDWVKIVNPRHADDQQLLNIIAPSLEAESKSAWEIKMEGYDSDYQVVFDQLDLVRRFGILGYSHIHMSFSSGIIRAHSRNQEIAHRLAVYFLFINEMFDLARQESERGVTAQLNPNSRPVLGEEVVLLRDALLEAAREPSYYREHSTFIRLKLHSLGFRNPRLYGGDRFGFEIRMLGYEPELQSRIFREVRDTLVNPFKVFLDSQGRSLDLASIAIDDSGIGVTGSPTAIDMLRWETINTVDRTVGDFLLQIGGLYYETPNYLQQNDMHLLWVLPMLNWESRPFLADRADQISADRAQYLAEIKELATMYSALSDPGPSDITVAGLAISDEFAEWVRRSEIWHVYAELF